MNELAPSPVSRQDRVFAIAEGDRWFQRNRAGLQQPAPTRDTPLMLLELYGIHPRAALEVGCANGYRLAALRQRYHCRAVGVELSQAAIADGRARFPDVELLLGQADAVPLQESFDLIILNFVLHWVDRQRLLASVAEVDRLLDDGGMLLIGDFLPATLNRRRYHHLPDAEVYTYKQDYAAIFLASGIYQPVALLSGDHVTAGLHSDVAEDDRTGTWLLRKRLTALYRDGGASGSPAELGG